MGLLVEGNLLSWEETKKYALHVRKHGIIQFINLFKKLKDHQENQHKWGDETEYIIVKFLEEKEQVKLSSRGMDVLTILTQKKLTDIESVKGIWTPECCSFMIESAPGEPYEDLMTDFNIVEQHLRDRRTEVAELTFSDEEVFTLCCYPRLGCVDFLFPTMKPTPNKGDAMSLFFPDECLNPGHSRFKAFTRNMRLRRGENVVANIPIYKDKHTKIPIDDSYKRRVAALPDHVYMDAMGLGTGCCALQFTIQAYNLTEARILYDQLANLCPLMLAFTAASPIHRGFLTDTDCRWKVLSGVTDCRTEEERGIKPLKESKFVVERCRYDSIAVYLSHEGEKYNDVSLIYHQEDYNKLVDNDVDPQMARHIAHLFTKDPVALYAEKLDQNDEEETDHYENINSTVWPTLRIKHPIPDLKMGWRIEFRPCEIQITDFENAAILCFMMLLTQVILSFKLNFLIPISKIDENMENAQRRNAIKNQKFWFRKNILAKDINGYRSDTSKDTLTQLNMNELFNGKKEEFPGFIPLIKNYLNGLDISKERLLSIQKYLRFIEKRASGEIFTAANWLRNFVTNHPGYRNNSLVTEKINYDLMKTIQSIQSGQKHCSLLLGPKHELINQINA